MKPAQEGARHEVQGAPSRRRRSAPLSAARLAESGRYADGNGLYLHVDPSGARRWVQRLVVGGRPRALGLGGYALVSLAEARRKARANRRLAQQGGDPLVARGVSRGAPTFREAAARVVAIHSEAWRKGGKTARQWRASMRDHVYPHIGARGVDKLTTADVMRTLLPIWTSKHVTAQKVRQRIGAVMKWAIAQGYRSDNPAGDAVTAALPKRPTLVRHRPALPHGGVAAAIAAVRGADAWVGAKLAFEFLVLTAARSAEVRLATWNEMDLVARVWTVPASRMKAKREHRVPLCGRAVEILREAETIRGGRGPGASRSPVCAVDRSTARSSRRSSGTSASPPSRTGSGRRSATGRRSGRTTRARSSRRRWPTRCGARPRRPTRGQTCSSGAAC